MRLLLSAELLKLRKRWMGWMMLGISMGLTFGALLLIAVSAQRHDRPYGGYPSALLAGPEMMAQSLAPLLMLVLGALMVGSEYGFDTWKNLLSRHARRAPLLLSKWLILLWAILVGTAILALWSQLLALVLRSIFHLRAEGEPELTTVLLRLGLIVWVQAITASMGLLGATLARSSIGGVVIGFVWLTLDGLLTMAGQVPEAIKRWLVTPAARNLDQVLGGAAAALPVWQSLVVLALYLLLPLGVALIVFQRRDLVG